MRCIMFHDWSKWEEVSMEMQSVYEDSRVTLKPTKFIVRIQRRECKHCGRIQESKLGGTD